MFEDEFVYKNWKLLDTKTYNEEAIIFSHGSLANNMFFIEKGKVRLISNENKLIKKVIHPLIRTHPETRKKCLYINPIRIENIINYTEQQTIDLLNQLMELVYSKKFEYRHKWQVGDFVIWDNRILMHKANGDYNMNEKRYLYRIMLKGDKPF